MVVVPVPVTWLLVSSISSTRVLPDVFLIVILPSSTSIASLKVRTILASSATLVALSAGEKVTVGVDKL